MKFQINLINISRSFCSILVHFILVSSETSFQTTTTTLASASGNETDKIALLKFKESISEDPFGVLGSWNGSAHFCRWRGVSCSARHQRVAAMDLEGFNLRGTVSPFIGNLSFLRSIKLGGNRFVGDIPPQVSHLFRLQLLNLSFNMLEGKIPANLSYCSNLVILSLGSNNLTGEIPLELSSLVKLSQLGLAQNNLSGEIPPSLGNISTLETFSVAYNNLEGTIPNELGRLKSLTFFGIGENNLWGEIPLSLYNITSLNIFSIAANRFNGTLPPNIGLKLPNLQGFGIGDNEFSGELPESFSNASQLQVLDIGKNYFSGQVPMSLGNLPNIWKIALGKNKLGNYSAHSLDFIVALTNCSKLEILDLSYNNFGGDLPNSVANLSTRLIKLFLGVNQISGNVPATLGNLVNLIVLSMWGNLISGVIPDSLGKLRNLQVLYLDTNKFSGNIPSSIGNFTKISELYLSHNRFEGTFPPSIVDCQILQDLQVSSTNLSGDIPDEVFSIFSLITIDLSRNSFRGSLPVKVSKLKNVNMLDLSDNNISGEIPTTIADCQSLEFLFLQGNYFRGNLPPSLASLRGLQYLDLSRNNLSGKIPEDLGKLRFLQYLNLSYNNLEGEVPQEGVFRNTSAISIIGNTNLCGGVQKLQLPRCLTNKSNQGMSRGLKLTIAIVSAVAVFLLVSVFCILYWRKKSHGKSSSATKTIGFLSKVEYKRLYQATNGFSPSMLIGKGSFGSVYKGILDQEENLVAIKVLNLHKKGADKSFLAECNALRNARHRNLIKVLTCCSSMDYNGDEFKALVFEYMPNGSLDKWLHPVTADEHRSHGLKLIQRLNIAIDVAFALDYLHSQCDPHIVHCDLKPANILLDNDLVAHVSDFGLARLFSNIFGFPESQTSTIGIKGTIGYAAPEYAMGCEPSNQGDSYSFGILVLEMFTGRRPTDEMFKDGFNLRSFVKTALPAQALQIADSTLLLSDVEEAETTFGESGSIAITAEEKIIRFESANPQSASLRACLVSVLEIGLSCSADAPKERMDMEDVIRKLENIRKALVDGEIRGHGQRTN